MKLVKWNDVKKEIKSISDEEKNIIEILAKYSHFYEGGSGYTFQVNVDDFNAMVNYIRALEKENEGLKISIEDEKLWYERRRR
jgi:uncharacterized protein YneR